MILDDYESSLKETPKAIVYCLTKGNCDKMKNKLELHYKNRVEAVSSSDSREHIRETMTGFKNGHIQIVCATTGKVLTAFMCVWHSIRVADAQLFRSVLGRGLDVNNIRFVFHAWLPLSLANYIQETGRAGRDGKKSYCILFYRPADHSAVANILKRHEHPESAMEKVRREMLMYCTQGDTCRYTVLAAHTRRLFGRVQQRCRGAVQCDICKGKSQKSFHDANAEIKVQEVPQSNQELWLRQQVEPLSAGKMEDRLAFHSVAAGGWKDSLGPDILDVAKFTNGASRTPVDGPLHILIRVPVALQMRDAAVSRVTVLFQKGNRDLKENPGLEGGEPSVLEREQHHWKEKIGALPFLLQWELERRWHAGTPGQHCPRHLINLTKKATDMREFGSFIKCLMKQQHLRLIKCCRLHQTMAILLRKAPASNCISGRKWATLARSVSILQREQSLGEYSGSLVAIVSCTYTSHNG